MKTFFSYTFATVLGLFLFFFLTFLLLLAIGSMAGGEKVSVKKNSVLRIDLGHPFNEREGSDPLQELGLGGGDNSPIGLIEFRETIRRAAADENIRGILLEGSIGRIGYATNEEVRAALTGFRKSGKFIYSYGEYFSESSYYTATVSDSIFLNPEGIVEFNGISSEVMFFKGALEKLEIKPEVFRVGEFKSAVEPFIREDMSDANRLQARSFINSIHSYNLSQVAASRKLPLEKVRMISDSMLARNAGSARDLGLVSRVAYFDQVKSSLMKKLKIEKEKDLHFISYGKYSKGDDETVDGNTSDNRIAVIVAEGEINTGKGDNQSIGSDRICEALTKARNDEKVKAVVIRINSPGGSALASDIMWREIQLLRQAKKPVIASMSDVAASGGYYMAMGCDAIVAHPNTITGSIGVFGLMFNAQDMFRNKLGVTFDGVKTGAYSDIGSGTRPFTDSERKIVQNEVDKIYETFTSKAAAGRRMDPARLRSLAGGRVWSGAEAKANGLVDEMGGMEKAIELAAARAKLGKDYKVKILPQKKSFVDELMEKFGAEARTRAMQNELGDLYPLLQQYSRFKNMQGIQARLPFDVRLN